MRATWGPLLTALLMSGAPAYAQEAAPSASPEAAADDPTNAFAEALRRPEPGWIPSFGIGEGIRLKLSGSIRGRVEHRYWTVDDTLPGFSTHRHDEPEPGDFRGADTTHFENRTRLAAALTTPSPWSVTVELQHTRLWSDNRDALGNVDQLDLYQGFVEYGGDDDTPWEVRAGRFAVPEFGDGRIVSGNDWDSLGRALDGVSVAWAPKGLRWSLWLTNTGVTDPVRSSFDGDDAMSFGGTALEVRALEWLDVDLYLIGRHFDQSYASDDPGETDRGRKMDVTFGTHVALKGGGVRLVGELYGQLGVQGADDVRAWAAVERIEYTPWEGDLYGIPQPTLFFEHAYATGDKRAGDGVRNTFDPLFPDYHRHLGPADQVGFSNVSALAVGWSQSMALFWKKLRPVTFTFVARGSFLDSQNDYWYDAKGNRILKDPTGDTASSQTLEGELSGWFTAALLDGALELSAGLAHWCPNNLLGDLNWREHSYRFWFSTQVRF